MVKYGNITNPTVNILTEIKRIRKLGFDFAEIGIEGPQGTPEILMKNRVKILSLVKDFNYYPIGHTSWWIELGTEYEPVRRGWIEEAKKIIDIASELRIPLVNFHSHSRGLYVKDEKAKLIILNNWVMSLKVLVKYARKYNIKIIFENTPERGEIADLEDFKYIVDRVPGLKVHLDIGHAFIGGGMETIKLFIETFKNKIEHIHVNDNHGKSDEHLPIGKGNINYKIVVDELKKIKYDKTISFEVFVGGQKAIISSLKKFKKIWR